MRTFAQKQNQLQKPVSSNLTRSHTATLGPHHRADLILHLQRTIGNQAVQRMFQTHAEELKAGLASTASPHFGHDFSQIPIHASAAGAIQTKLAINKPGDEYEQEADRVAEQVMRMPEPQLQHTYGCGVVCPEGQTEPLGHGHERLQTKHPGSGELGQTAIPPIVHEVIRSPGQPLDPAARAFMEPRFGHDLSQVRVHADPRAADSVRALDALAYTVGRDVVFGAGQHTMGSNEGRKLIAHELVHVAQQSFTTQAVQRKDDKKKKGSTTPKLIFNEIKKRNPVLAELITLQSIDWKSPKEPPAVKGGSLKDGEEHVWKVRITAIQGLGSSQTDAGGELKAKLKGHTQVTHFIDIKWVLPLASDAEFIKQTKSEDEAFTLTAAEPLFHELLHARIMMERDPHWASPHTQVFQDYTKLIQIAGSPAVDKERQALKKQIGVLAVGGGRAKTSADMMHAEDSAYDFLIHEKYDADAESKPFGKAFSNAKIAKKNSDEVARRLGVGEKDLQPLKNKLAAAAEKLFDKLDQAAQTSTPSSAPTTKQPEK